MHRQTVKTTHELRVATAACVGAEFLTDMARCGPSIGEPTNQRDIRKDHGVSPANRFTQTTYRAVPILGLVQQGVRLVRTKWCTRLGLAELMARANLDFTQNFGLGASDYCVHALQNQAEV